MSRWNPVVFRRCACTPGACPADVRFEPRGRSRAAAHVLVHQPEPARVPAVLPPAPSSGARGLPFLLLGLAVLLLATLNTPRAR